MKILFIGDVCGSPGRETIAEVLPQLKKQKEIDFVIANAENSAGGRGITRKIVRELSSYGVDFITSGDHVWRQREFLNDLNDESLAVVRPGNFPEDIPYGKGMKIVDLGGKGRIAIANLQGFTFMRELVLDPFRYADKVISELEGENLQAIIFDFHAEATSEKAALAHYIDGRITAVLGTHTHVGTVDTQILPKGTAFVTDVGMTGPRDSVLWVKKDIIIHNTMFPYKKAFVMEKHGRRIFNSVILEVSDMKCESITRFDKVLGDI